MFLVRGKSRRAWTNSSRLRMWTRKCSAGPWSRMPPKKPWKGPLAPCHPFCRLQHACLSVFDTAPLHIKVIQLVRVQSEMLHRTSSKCAVRLEKMIHHPALLASTGWCTQSLPGGSAQPRRDSGRHIFPGVLAVNLGRRWYLLTGSVLKDLRLLIFQIVEFWLCSLGADLYWHVFDQMPVSFVAESWFPAFWCC